MQSESETYYSLKEMETIDYHYWTFFRVCLSETYYSLKEMETYPRGFVNRKLFPMSETYYSLKEMETVIKFLLRPLNQGQVGNLLLSERDGNRL